MAKSKRNPNEGDANKIQLPANRVHILSGQVWARRLVAPRPVQRLGR